MDIKIKNKKGVVYTCITGDYDRLKNHSYVNHDWNYVCFTNNLFINKDDLIWEIRPLVFDKLDNVRNQRWHKIHAHLLFPDYEKSIYVDGNIDFLNNNVFADVDIAIQKSRKISTAVHPNRNCIYKEANVCISEGKDLKKIIKEQVKLIKKDNFPKNYGLFEDNIIYREHNNEGVVKIMNDWWWWVQNYSRRDQLSFNYVLWKNNFKLTPLSVYSYRKNMGVDFIYGKNHVTKEELEIRNNIFKRVIRFLKNITICK